MKAELTYIDGMAFESKVRGHRFVLDTSSLGGKDRGPSPKELLLPSVLGCTGMDVVGLLRKNKVAFESFALEADAQTVSEHPKVFNQFEIVYKLTGKDLPVDKVREAVELSMTKYCGVSAMISRAVPIFYTIMINGEIEHRDQAKFY